MIHCILYAPTCFAINVLYFHSIDTYKKEKDIWEINWNFYVISIYNFAFFIILFIRNKKLFPFKRLQKYYSLNLVLLDLLLSDKMGVEYHMYKIMKIRWKIIDPCKFPLTSCRITTHKERNCKYNHLLSSQTLMFTWVHVLMKICLYHRMHILHNNNEITYF